MNMKQSLMFKTRIKDSNDLFNKIRNRKNSFFYMSEVIKYVKLGVVTCTNVKGNNYHVKSNVSSDEIEIKLL